MPGKVTTHADEQGRVCTLCEKWKPWEQFNKATGGFRGKRSRCRNCDGAVGAKWKEDSNYYQSNRDAILQYKRDSYCPIAKKNYNLQHKYDITLDDFMSMLKAQQEKCKVCLRDIIMFAGRKSKKNGAVVDHDHLTGRVRGLLCHSCNRAIGLLSDNTENLRRAIEHIA